MIKIKTLIELFDDCQLENVMAALSFNPDHIVFIGYREIMTAEKRRSIERFFKIKNLSFQIRYEYVNRYDYNAIKDKLISVIDTYPDCGMDLTGGTELLLTAAGAVCEKYPIPTFQFDISRKKLIKINNCKNIPPIKTVSFSIKEYIVLNGGAIIKKSSSDPLGDLNEEFMYDIEKAWNIRRKSADGWRDMIASLRQIENMGYPENEISVTIDNSILSENALDEIKEFIDAGFIRVTKKEHYIRVAHKNRLIHRLLLKVGSIFEFYTYAAAKEISDRKSGFYSDMDMSVFVDWDGIINPKGNLYHDTINEVDVVLIKDNWPVFISCKSGELKKESLYELETVSKKFGEKYAKMIIVATHISYNDNAKDAILQRAKDMGIEIIYNADVMPKERFLTLLEEKSQ